MKHTFGVSNSTLIEINTTLIKWKPLFPIGHDQTQIFSTLKINIQVTIQNIHFTNCTFEGNENPLITY